MKINQDVVCVLKKNKDNLIELNYEPIINPLKDSLKELKQFFADKSNSKLDVFNFIKNHIELKVILNHLNYCEYLSLGYGGIKNEVEELFNTSFCSKDELYKICEKRALAYSLDKTYEKCLTNSDILTYSHRKVGWSFPRYELNSNFTIHFYTNFGFGYVTFFYTKLRYKEIDIINFYDWIYYREAKLSEIIAYTIKHELTDESWEQAMKYGRDAYNLLIKNEAAFVSKYIAGECDKLISGLNEVQLRTKFKLRRSNDRFNPIFDEIEFKGHDLIEYRGEKISGALSFINSINELKKIISIQNYIDKIENYNKVIQPVLVKDMDLIKFELQILNLEIGPVKLRLEQLKLQEIEYSTYRSKYKEELKEEKLSLEKFDTLFAEKYSEYLKFKDEYLKISKSYDELKSKISSLEKSLENIDKYNFTIEKYFIGKDAVVIGEI